MNSDSAQILVKRLLETGEDNIDWSPDPEAEPLYGIRSTVNSKYPLPVATIRRQTENGIGLLRGTVEVERALWHGYESNRHPNLLNIHVSKLVTGSANGLRHVEYAPTKHPTNNPDNIILKFNADVYSFLHGELLEAGENIDWSPDPQAEPVRGNLSRLDTELLRLGFAQDEKTGRMTLKAGRLNGDPRQPKHRFVVWQFESSTDKQPLYRLAHYVWLDTYWAHASTSARKTEDSFLAMLKRMSFEAYTRYDED